MNRTLAIPRHARLVASLALVVALAAVAGHLAQPEAPPSTARSSAALQSQGYPGPTAGPPTATPAPIGGRFPPPAVPHEIIALHQLPASTALQGIVTALETGDAGTLAALTVGEALALDPLGDTEGYGVRLPEAEVAALLGALFAGGSAPVVQGAFAPDCLPRDGTCRMVLLVTGWAGAVPFPTRSPDELLGQTPPELVPTEVAAWELIPDSADQMWWRAWRVADGYHAAVEQLAAWHGTYYVFR